MNSSQGENPTPLVLRDEEGQTFAFLPVRWLREGSEVFLLAEREGCGTLHVLRREGDAVGLVRERETLRLVGFRLEVLRRAMEGELIERGGESPQFLGVIHRGEVEGRSYLVAADLADPATVLAFEPRPDGLVLADEGLATAIREEWEQAVLPWESAAPNLEASTLGLSGERISVATPAGTRAFETAGRLIFEGRDLLFLHRPDAPGSSQAAEVLPGGCLEAVRDEPFLLRLRAHLEASAR